MSARLAQAQHLSYTPSMTEIEKIKSWLGEGSVNFFGLPFSGKDSQARRLADKVNGVVLSSGEIIRNSVIPADIKEIMDNGELIPSDDFVRVVLPYLSRDDFKSKPLILSSVGRWKGEEQSVVNALDQANHPLKAVIYLALDESIVRERFKREENVEVRGERDDDKEEHLVNRIKEFNEKTIPVIEYYRQEGLLIEIDASLSKDDVESAVASGLSSLI